MRWAHPYSSVGSSQRKTEIRRCSACCCARTNSGLLSAHALGPAWVTYQLRLGLPGGVEGGQVQHKGPLDLVERRHQPVLLAKRCEVAAVAAGVGRALLGPARFGRGQDDVIFGLQPACPPSSTIHHPLPF